ncbi:MAG: hypothetical protein HC915_18120 [Anaerolineae bacterium]|nr:hypothetical protein [Anaerolineae bacterium]
MSTGWAYRTYREQFGATYANPDENMGDRRSRFHSDTAIAAIAMRDVRQIAESLRNDLERVVLPAYPKVAELRDVLTQAGSLGAMMSGSGPTVFALAESREQARQIRETAAEAMDDPDLDFWVAKCITTGIQVADRE